MSITMILSWIWANIIKLGLIGVVAVNIKKIINIFILQPLQGDDKKTSMNELAKFVILILLCFSFYVNGIRTTEWPVYSDTTIGYMLAGVFAIAAINPVAGMINKKKKEEK
jgi:hypothetical protein